MGNTDSVNVTRCSRHYVYIPNAQFDVGESILIDYCVPTYDLLKDFYNLDLR